MYRTVSISVAALACTAYGREPDTTTAPPTTATTSTKTTTSTTTIGDCECKKSWIHNEFKCNSKKNGTIGTVTFSGCPSLESLQKCEDSPQESWCKTTKETCLQQQGDDIGEGWAYCSHGAQEAQIPKCTCAAVWLNGHGSACQGVNQQKRTRGCPTIEELKACDPDYAQDQSWCLTNEDECTDQVDCPDCNVPEYAVGKQWSYCDEPTQIAELPDCECKNSWTPENWKTACPDWPDAANPPSFNMCPTPEQLARCNQSWIEEQSYCETKQDRCKQQSDSDLYPSMINEGWSYCEPKDNKAVLPTCECKDVWDNADTKCADETFTFNLCPSVGQLKLCDSEVAQPWCETTYKRCAEQNYEATNDHWVYCDSVTEEPDLPFCECQDTWIHSEPGSNCEGYDTKFRGCPTEEMLHVCEPETYSWCMTKDMFCKEQTGDSIGDGWTYCDSDTQLAAGATRRGSAIGLTFIFTVVLCGGLFITLMFQYRKYLKEKQAVYSKVVGGYEDH